MKRTSVRIATGGERRLRGAVEAKVRDAYREKLSGATYGSERAAIEKEIQREIALEMKRVASPFSLWNSSGLFLLGLLVVFVGVSGCQTFRASQSEADKARDEKVGQVVADTGTLLYQFLPCSSWRP